MWDSGFRPPAITSSDRLLVSLTHGQTRRRQPLRDARSVRAAIRQTYPLLQSLSNRHLLSRSKDSLSLPRRLVVGRRPGRYRAHRSVMGSPRTWQALAPIVALLGIVSGCHRKGAPDSFTVASVRLSCWPIARGMQCQLLALSHDAGQPPRDVTDHTVWRPSGPLDVQISQPGCHPSVPRMAMWTSKRCSSRDGPIKWCGWPRIVQASSSSPFADTPSSWTKDGFPPSPGVRIEVIRGPDSGRSVTTGADGAYELGVVPGTLAILATRVGARADRALR